jgi:hypothetical protein
MGVFLMHREVDQWFNEGAYSYTKHSGIGVPAALNAMQVATEDAGSAHTLHTHAKTHGKSHKKNVETKLAKHGRALHRSHIPISRNRRLVPLFTG